MTKGLALRLGSTAGVFLALLMAQSVGASQVQGHLYMASKMAGSEGAGTYLGSASALRHAYLLGSLAPDSSWISHLFTNKAARESQFKSFKLPPELAGLSGTLEDAHTDHAVELCLNLLKSATSKSEGAYALGWLTHFITDSRVHDLINRWGGYFYGVGVWRHKLLEAVETKHVLSKHSGEMFITRLEAGFVTSGAVSRLLISAFAATYPGNPNYQEPNSKLFISALVKGEDLVAQGSRWFYTQSTRPAEEIEALKLQLASNSQQAALISSLPSLPTEEQYKLLMTPPEVVVEPSDKALTITVKLADSKLYARFLLEWEQATQAAIAEGNPIVSLCADYLVDHMDYLRKLSTGEIKKGTPDPGDPDLEIVGKVLTGLNPKRDLDNPQSYEGRGPQNLGASYDATSLTCDYSVRSAEGEALATAAGANLPLERVVGKFDVTGIAASVGATAVSPTPTTATLELPLTAAKYDFRFRACMEPDVLQEGLDSVAAKGSYPDGGMTGDGAIAVGDIFNVEVTLPAEVAKKPGEGRWVLMAAGQELKAEDVPLIQMSMADAYRTDLQCIEQSLEGNRLRAKLQFTNVRDAKLAGPQQLLMIWFPPGKASTDLSGAMEGLTDQLDAANKALEAVQKAMDTLDERQKTELDEKMTQYSEELGKTQLSDEDKQRLFGERYNEEMRKLGVDIAKIIQDGGTVQKMEEVSAMPFHVAKPFTLRAAELRLSAATGWQADEPPMASIAGASHTVTGTAPDGTEAMSLSASVHVSLDDNPDREKQLEEWKGQGDPLTVGDFTGRVIVTKNWGGGDSPKALETSATALLRKGKLYMAFGYSWTGNGHCVYKVDEKGKVTEEVIFDGPAELDKAAETAASDIAAMIQGIRIVPKG